MVCFVIFRSSSNFVLICSSEFKLNNPYIPTAKLSREPKKSWLRKDKKGRNQDTEMGDRTAITAFLTIDHLDEVLIHLANRQCVCYKKEIMKQVFRNVGMTKRKMVGGDWDPLTFVHLPNPWLTVHCF